MENDPYENISKVQQMYYGNKAIQRLHKHMEMMNRLNSPFQQVQRHLDLVNKSALLNIVSLNWTREITTSAVRRFGSTK